MEYAIQQFVEDLRARAASIGSTFKDRGAGNVVPLISGALTVLILFLVLWPEGQGSRGDSNNSFAAFGVPDGSMGGGGGILQGLTLTSLISGFMVGAALIGIVALWNYIVEKHGWTVLALIAATLVLVGDTTNDIGVSTSTSGMAFLLGFVVGVAVFAKLLIKVEPKTTVSNIFGSSRWATREDLEEWELLGELSDGDGLFLGEEKETGTPIIYSGDMHALTVAPTRTGKGATAIIPNLLRSKGSILVIDPKGENARRTAKRRKAGGQAVHIVDPWSIASKSDQFGEGAPLELLAHYNPLDALNPSDPDLATDAMMLADALVVSSEREPFWTDEAKAMIYGFILYVVTDPNEKGKRTLGRVREILCLRPASNADGDKLAGTFDEILLRMAMSDHPLVQASAFRLVQKDIKERSNVISTAQSNTHFLDSPVIRKSLSRSDFSFADLKKKSATVYLVLPLDRLPSFNRWLRLLITSAMIDLTRTPANPKREPVRVILDEFAALEKLKSVETAFGTMAGLGVQLWVITQDFSQLMRLYGDKGWQTFVSNSGVFQYFGSRDYETAKYAENLTGLTTLKKRSISLGWSKSGGAGGSSFSSSENISIDDVQRPLAYADQMMTLHRDLQVLFIENRYPIIARKHWWFRQAHWKAMLGQVEKKTLPRAEKRTSGLWDRKKPLPKPLM